MPKIKRLPADDWFSKCVRERADWICEVCHTGYERGSQGLHCSHYFGRRAYGVRFDPDNAFAHCFGCHQKMGSNPDDFTRWATEQLGEGCIELLREKREDISLAKSIKKFPKDVAKHYKEQHEEMLRKREAGEIGRIEFEGY